MKRGPKPKPTALKLAEGVRADRIGNPSPVAPGLPDKPAWLPESAAKEWDRIAPKLVAAGILTPLDEGMFALLCIAYADVAAMTKEIAERGRVVKSKRGGSRLDPMMKSYATAWSELRRLLSEFGCSPSSRSGVTVAPSAAPSKLDLLIQGKRTS